VGRFAHRGIYAAGDPPATERLQRWRSLAMFGVCGVGCGYCQTLTDWTVMVAGKTVAVFGGPPHSEGPATARSAIK
jgi:hypothetical protein